MSLFRWQGIRPQEIGVWSLGREDPPPPCPGEGNGNPLQYSCLGNPMDRRAWQATAHVVTRVGHDLPTKPPPHTVSSQRSGFQEYALFTGITVDIVADRKSVV